MTPRNASDLREKPSSPVISTLSVAEMLINASMSIASTKGAVGAADFVVMFVINESPRVRARVIDKVSLVSAPDSMSDDKADGTALA